MVSEECSKAPGWERSQNRGPGVGPYSRGNPIIGGLGVGILESLRKIRGLGVGILESLGKIRDLNSALIQ